jgi:hypothetical protein
LNENITYTILKKNRHNCSAFILYTEFILFGDLFLSDGNASTPGCILYFNNSRLAPEREAEDVILEYGKTFLEFSPVTNTTNMVSEVNINAWNPAKQEFITAQASFGDIDSKGGEIVDKQFGGVIFLLVDKYSIDQNKADQRALDYLTRKTRNYITGKGKTFGNPDIQADKAGSEDFMKRFTSSVKDQKIARN